MTRTRTRWLTAGLVAGGLGLCLAPVAHAADTTTTTLTPSAEAWFQPNPTCASPLGCQSTSSAPAAVPTNPYPAGSLHVGETGGQETARSYLALPLSSTSGTVTAATLDVPLDTSGSDGSNAPDTSSVQVCLATAAITPASGSLDDPPAVDCAHAVKAAYVATPAPHLHADLVGLGSGLVSATGLALLPTNGEGASTSWRVVFSAHDRTDAAKTAPASVALTVQPPADPGAGSGPATVDTAPAAAAPQLGAVAPPAGTGFASTATHGSSTSPDLGSTSTPPSDGAAPQTDAQAPATADSVTPVATTVTFGYAYPVVFLLPLALLVLVPLISRALTKDLTPTPAPEPPGPSFEA